MARPFFPEIVIGIVPNFSAHVNAHFLLRTPVDKGLGDYDEPTPALSRLPSQEGNWEAPRD